MAKGKNDLILRDRLQFTFDGNGDLAVVYGRIDLSDYVSVVNNEGLAIKEVRIQVRDPSTPNTGSFRQMLNTTQDALTAAFLKIFASTTAYESAQDVGIGSPNVFSLVEHQQYTFPIEQGGSNVGGSSEYQYFEYGTPDLHPDGYTVVSDVLIGVSANDCTVYANQTLELDVMLIAETVKVTKNELKDMLTQATDL